MTMGKGNGQAMTRAGNDKDNEQAMTRTMGRQ